MGVINELKASMFDCIVNTYLETEDKDLMIECILSKLDVYIDLMIEIDKKGEKNGVETNC